MVGFLVNCETRHTGAHNQISEWLGSYAESVIEGGSDVSDRLLRAHPLEVMGHRPALPCYSGLT